MKLYVAIAKLIEQRNNCIKSNNTVWQERSTDRIESLVQENFPHGSGFDSGTKIELDKCTGDKLVFIAEFHHMNDVGYYDGWTYHTVTVTPSLAHGYHQKISGINKCEIKDHIAQCFGASLDSDVDIYAPLEPATI